MVYDGGFCKCDSLEKLCQLKVNRVDEASFSDMYNLMAFGCCGGSSS